MIVLYIVDILLFVVFAVNVLYLFVFCFAAQFRHRGAAKEGVGEAQRRIAVLVPAYREDRVIMECVESCLAQSYPRVLYDVVVISDRMETATDKALSRLPIKLVNVCFENSTKAKALNFAMAELGDGYDIAVVLDADNIIMPDFLAHVAARFGREGVRIVQAHRTAKNLNTPLALLDAVSEEINNTIFRQGHVNLSLSAALIGSAMAFEYGLFKRTMASIDAIGGFDRALELVLLRQGIGVGYMPDDYVLDEKVQHHSDFTHQRRRWLSAQLHYLCVALKDVPAALREGNWDFCDKVFQQTTIPRVLLLGFCGLFAVVLSLVDMALAAKWWMLFGVLVATLLMAVPRRLLRRELLMAVARLPYFFVLMTLNIFKLRGANKKFIHTSHGIK